MRDELERIEDVIVAPTTINARMAPAGAVSCGTKAAARQEKHADLPSLPRFIDRSAEFFSRGTSVVARLTKPCAL